MRNTSLKILQPLEQLTNSRRIMTVSFGFLYRGARPEEPGHNRSSSPLAALADRTERRAANPGAGLTQHLTKDMIRS